MIRLWSSTALIALHLAAWNPTIAACGPTYTIQDLGTLGGTTSAGSAINAAGSVTGSSWDEPGQRFRAFRYVDGIGMIDLGVLAPGTQSFGNGINRFGQVAGSSQAFANRATVATATGLIDLGTLFGGVDDASVAFDINDRGQVTGWSSSASTVGAHAFVWTAAAGMRDIGTLGGNYTVGWSINESGQIAGESGDVGPMGLRTRVAFRFTEGVGMIRLGTLAGGTQSAAYGINDSGQVVGESDRGPILKFPKFKGRSFGQLGEEPHAFLWTEGVGMRELRCPPVGDRLTGSENDLAV